MGAEGGRVGGTERGKEGRRVGTRAKPGNQLVYHICVAIRSLVTYRTVLVCRFVKKIT